MANVLSTDFSYTYDGPISTEVFYKPSVATPDMLKIFTVKPNIKSGQKLNLVGVLENIVKAYSSCARTSTGSGLSITNRTILTTELEVWLEECKDTFEDTIFETALASGLDANNLTGTDIDKIIQSIVLQGMKLDNFRIFSFGDTDNPSSNYNMLNGLWSTLIAGVGTSYCVTRVGTTLGTASSFSGSAALAILQDLYDGAPIILKNVPEEEKGFFVTGTIFDGYMKYLQSVSGVEGSWGILQNGKKELMFNGVPVIPIRAWDRTLTTDFPLGANVRHLALYTTPKNHIVGVEKAADQGKISTWYEKKDRKFYVEGQYRMGYQYIHCDLQAISY